MKKFVFLIFLLGTLVFIGNLVFSSDYFTEAPVKVEYQKYNETNEQYGEVKMIEDQEKINRLIKVFNEAEHEDIQFEFPSPADYELRLLYENGTTDRIGIWINWTEEYDLFQSNLKDGSFRLKDEEEREAFKEILQ